MAPPTAGIMVGVSLFQLAKSPLSDTSNAPMTQMSRWPPRTIVKESA
jgi:hypothetical protein